MAGTAEEFMNIPNGIDDKLPFNWDWKPHRKKEERNV
jgi:hypothetical protein